MIIKTQQTFDPHLIDRKLYSQHEYDEIIKEAIKHLPTAEEALKLSKEKTERQLDANRLPDQEQLADVKSRMGTPMTHETMISKVRKMLNYRVWAEDSINYPGGMNFYMTHMGQKICLNTPFLKGIMPEYTILHLDDRGLPGKRTVGWREVLARLIRTGHTTVQQCEEHFGEPTPTPSERWQQTTRGK